MLWKEFPNRPKQWVNDIYLPHGLEEYIERCGPILNLMEEATIFLSQGPE